MKKTTLGIISLSLSLFAAGALAADSAANKNAPATPAQMALWIGFISSA